MIKDYKEGYIFFFSHTLPHTFGKGVSIVVYAHFFLSDKKCILLKNVHTFFYAHFSNLCTSWRFYPVFFLCDIPKCAYKLVDGNAASDCSKV